jgi:hypothetical protein
MDRTPTYGRLASIAADQWGLITRRQGELAGVSAATLKRLAGTGGGLERLAHGVYRLAGAPLPDHADLRAAWLQLAPETPAWQRTPEQGVVSHRSAARLYGLGDLPADRHEFTLPVRRQSRRADIRLHHRSLSPGQWITLQGLPVTRPSRIASDLLWDREDPAAVAQITADAIREAFDDAGTFADELVPHAAHFGLRRGDGLAVLRWLLDLVGDPQTPRYMEQAEEHVRRASAENSTVPRMPASTGRG